MTEKELDIMFANLDDLLLAGRFDEVDNILAATDIGQADDTLLLVMLTATVAARDKLSKRQQFFQQVKAKVGAELVRGLG